MSTTDIAIVVVVPEIPFGDKSSKMQVARKINARQTEP
jgi:hypothetical protein